MVHIHQSGTLVTYCGLPVQSADTAWEGAHQAECPTCKSHFNYHGSNAIGR